MEALMTSTPQRTFASGAGLLLLVAAGCSLPPGGDPPDGDLTVQVTSTSSDCENDVCTGEIVFRVTNPIGNPATSEEPFPTVDADSGTAQRDVSQSTCDDGTLSPGESCTETYDLADGDSLTGTISVDAGNLTGGTTYSAA
jgi:hypothetical protein